jgi:DNA polymerase-3 subunit delta'
MLPATIISRCQKLPLSVPEEKVAKRWLSKVSHQHPSISKVLQMTKGRPLLALEALEAGGVDAFESFRQLMESVRRGDLSPLTAAQQSGNFDTVEALEWFLIYVHEIATADVVASANQDLYYFLDRLNANYKMMLRGSTINQQLLWEEIFMSWSQVFDHR